MLVPAQRLDNPDDVVVRGDALAFAWMSACGRYRYMLGRTWNPNKKTLGVCMLNPSTADERIIDPTIRKCLHIAQRDGYGALIVTNLYALRATDPAVLKEARERGVDIVGRYNDSILGQMRKLDTVCAAWGTLRWKFVGARVAEVRTVRPAWSCFGVSKEGHPLHPCYLPNDTKIVPWTPAP